MSLIIPRLEGLSLQGYSVLNFFFNVPRKNRSPNPSLSGEHGAIYTLSLNAAYRMNLKPQLCICHPTHDQVDSAHLQQLAVFYVFFSHSMIAIFAILLLGLLKYRSLCALLSVWRDGPRRCLRRPTCSKTLDFGGDEE
jgi:hypothetical protein